MAPRKKPESKPEDGPKLVKMVKGERTADIHPDEVANMQSYGWVIVEE